MNEVRKSPATRIIVVVSFLVMLAVNALANILPINGQTTGAVSDKYHNLFAPAGLTFAIWGLIYLLLAIYVIFQIVGKSGSDDPAKARRLNQIGVIFTISSLANAVWIFAWHYEVIPASMALMAVILICLMIITQIIKKTKLSSGEKFWLRLPFSVYFGWITVATIANATTLFVSLGWDGGKTVATAITAPLVNFDGFGLSIEVWTVIILAVGLLIGLATMLANRDLAYGLVLTWAYFGILLKHIQASGFNGQYPMVITASIVALVGFLAGEIYLLVPRKTA